MKLFQRMLVFVTVAIVQLVIAVGMYVQQIIIMMC